MPERRLILGTDVISTIIANSTPLADKVRLVQHPDDLEDDYNFTRDTRGNASFKIRILIEGTDAADTQTTIDAIYAKVTALKTGEVKYEYDVGAKRFELPLVFHGSFEADTVLRAHELGATIDIEFTSTVPANTTETPQPSAPSGAISGLSWNVSTNPQGYSFAIGEVIFSTAASANTWVNGLENGTGVPYWMGNEWTLVTNENVFEDRPSGFTGNNDHVVRVKMQQQIAEVVGVAAMEVFRDWGWSLLKVERGANSGRARGPGHDVILTGQMTPKLGKIGALNPGDSSALSPAGLDKQIDNALDALVQEINSRLPDKWTELYRQYDSPARDSETTFTIKGVMTDPIANGQIDFDEQVSTRYLTDQTDIVISNKTVRTFHSAAGIRVFLDHRITIQSFKRPRYKMPTVSGGTWLATQGNIPEPIPDQHQNGEIIYRFTAATSWRRVPSGPGDIVEAPSLGSELSAKGLQSG